MHNGLIGSVDDQVVLNQIIRAETKEIHARRHQIARLRCGRRLDHHADRNCRIVLQPFQIQFALHLGDDLARRIQIINGRDERQKNASRPVYGSAIQTAELFFEQAGVFQAEPQPADAKTRIRSIPAFLIDPDVDRSERDGRAPGRLQHKRIVGDQRFFVGLFAFPKEVELRTIQADRFASIRDGPAHLFAEIDVRSQRNLNPVFCHRRGRCHTAIFLLEFPDVAVAASVFRQCFLGRRANHDSALSVDDQLVSRGDFRQLCGTHDGRNFKGSGHDGGMGKGAASLCRQTDNTRCPHLE